MAPGSFWPCNTCGCGKCLCVTMTDFVVTSAPGVTCLRPDFCSSQRLWTLGYPTLDPSASFVGTLYNTSGGDTGYTATIGYGAADCAHVAIYGPNGLNLLYTADDAYGFECFDDNAKPLICSVARTFSLTVNNWEGACIPPPTITVQPPPCPQTECGEPPDPPWECTPKLNPCDGGWQVELIAANEGGGVQPTANCPDCHNLSSFGYILDQVSSDPCVFSSDAIDFCDATGESINLTVTVNGDGSLTFDLKFYANVGGTAVVIAEYVGGPAFLCSDGTQFMLTQFTTDETYCTGWPSAYFITFLQGP